MSTRRFHESKFAQDGFIGREKQSRHNSDANNGIRKVNAKSYIHLFLETSSIHGLNHFIASNRHPCEM